MTTFFRPYEGRKPYIFVSYSHKDSEKVLETIRPIHEQLYRLWYDEGIPAGSDWPRNIEVHMRNCRMVLFFLSRTALASPNCLSEIRTAVKQGKTVLLLKLEEIPEEALEPRWKKCLEHAVPVEAGETAAERTEHILACQQLTDEYLGTPEDFRVHTATGWGGNIGSTIAMILATILLAASLGGLVAIATGVIVTPTPAPTDTPASQPEKETPGLPTATVPKPTEEPAPSPTDAPEPTQTPVVTPAPTAWIRLDEDELDRVIDWTGREQEERAVRGLLRTGKGEDISYRSLHGIEELYYVGSMAPRNLAGLSVAEDGAVTMNSTAAGNGEVKDLELVSAMPYLRKLALVKQPVTDISGLSGLTLLEEINLASSPVSSLDELADLLSLRTIHLEHTRVSDLTPLGRLMKLETVTVSRDMLPLVLDPEARYEVVLVK